MALVVKNLPEMQEMRVQSLHWDNILEEGMATHSSILAQTVAHGITKSWTEATKHAHMQYYVWQQIDTQQILKGWMNEWTNDFLCRLFNVLQTDFVTPPHCCAPPYTAPSAQQAPATPLSMCSDVASMLYAFHPSSKEKNWSHGKQVT